MDGIILINKPQGMTSREVVNKISKLLQIKKIGHMGVLDPMATGVLVVCIGKATKLTELLLNSDKEYKAEVTLGLKTDTLDITGNIIEQAKVADLKKEQIREVLNNLVGESLQEVPLYSNVKIKGKRLREYAKDKEAVALPKRKITIKKLELTGSLKEEADIVKFNIVALVSKGTYIRSLVRDIGLKIGYPACMSLLERTKQGFFKIEECNKMSDILANKYNILTMKESLRGYPVKKIYNETLKKVQNGMKLDKFFEEERMVLVNEEDEVVAIYHQDNKDKTKVKPLQILKNT